MNFAFYILAGINLLIFGGFAMFSYREKERRAALISMLIAIGATFAFVLLTLLSPAVKSILLTLIGFGLLLLLVLSLLPMGKIEFGNDIPKTRFDERDIMFARARLQPGSKNFKAYYEMRPENKKVDDHTRTKPGLLSPKAKLANEVLFTSSEASFTFTEIIGAMVEGEPAENQLVFPKDKMTKFVKGLAVYYGAFEVGFTRLQPYHLYSHIGRGPGTYGAEIPIEHDYAIAFTVEMD